MTTDIKNTYGLKHNPDVFSTMGAAVRSAERSVKMQIIIMGEDEKYWSVCMADAQRLVKQGFEVAF